MQLRVMEELSLAYTYDEIKSLEKKHRNYMMHDLIAKSFLTIFYVMADYDKEKKEAYKEYFKKFKKENRALYYKLRYRTRFCVPFLLIPPLRRLAVMIGYKYIVKSTNWN